MFVACGCCLTVTVAVVTVVAVLLWARCPSDVEVRGFDCISLGCAVGVICDDVPVTASPTVM